MSNERINIHPEGRDVVRRPDADFMRARREDIMPFGIRAKEPPQASSTDPHAHVAIAGIRARLALPVFHQVVDELRRTALKLTAFGREKVGHLKLLFSKFARDAQAASGKKSPERENNTTRPYSASERHDQ
jgi:hypothetical protein